MHVEPPEGATQTRPDDSPQSSDLQDISKDGAQAGSILQQVAQKASESAHQPDAFDIYDKENGPQDSLSHSLKISELDLKRSLLNDSIIVTSMEAPTTSLAAIAGDTAIEGDTGHGRVSFPDIGAGQHVLDNNVESWVAPNVDGGSFGASPQNRASSVIETQQHQIQAFAKLEFDDGEFYMNTYAVEIGRDVYAARQAADIQARQDSKTKSRKRNGSTSNARQRSSQNMDSSVTSENGEITVLDNDECEPTRKSRPRKRKSWSLSPQQLSRKSSMLLSNGKTDYNALAMASLVGLDLGPQDFGPNSLMPAPELVPLVPIHPPALPEGAPSGGKSISRKHIRIAYNFEESLFEVQILGRNGGFVDDEWYAQGDVQTLTNGSLIQIGGVGIRFVLPDVAPGETGADTGLGTDQLSGGKTSFDMAESIEGGNDGDGDVDENEECSRILDVKNEEGEDQDEDEDEEEEESEESEAVQRRAKGKKKPEPEPVAVPKRKGPGRPPKNGVISKREQALLARQARANAKVAVDRDARTPQDPKKGKAGKDTKVVKKEQPVPQINGKRKYTKRKRAGANDDQRPVRDSTEKTDSVPPEQSIAAKLPPKPAKEKKPPKPPRSPSPVWDEATLTPEQLTKPPQNYIVLIHEALSSSKTGAMALPQIYRAMQRKYPYFKLRATTVGWQSSVRHNLSQNVAFRKIERDGKGWMWGLVPGVSIEREKKRRATPPPVPQQPYYPPGPPPMQYTYQYPGVPPPNGRMPPNHYGMPPGMPPAQVSHGLPPRRPHGFPLPLVNAQSESNYQSPYQSTPPLQQSSAPARPPQDNSSSNGTGGHYPNATSQRLGQPSDITHQAFRPAPDPSSAPNQSKSEALNSLSGKSTSGANDKGAAQAIARYKSDYIDSMPDKARAEVLVTSAINRALGTAAADEAEDPQEKEIIGEIATMLSDLSKKSMEAQRRASDDPARPSKPIPTPIDHDSAPSYPATTPEATEAKNAPTNGDAYRRNNPMERTPSGDNSLGKRPLENRDGDDVTEQGQPATKRVAIET